MAAEGLRTLDLPVLGMTCASCVGRVEKAIRAVPGVTEAQVNLAAERAHVALSSEGSAAAVAAAIKSAGYEPMEEEVVYPGALLVGDDDVPGSGRRRRTGRL